MASKFKVGLVQMAVPRDTGEAEDKAAKLALAAAEQGAEVICLPELYRTPYFCQSEDISLFDLAEDAKTGPSAARFSAIARQEKVAIIVPIFERRAPGLYHNSAIIFDETGKQAGLYRKMHIPDDPNFYEKFYFTPGDLGFKAIDVKAGRIGTLICWDQWYPEAARLTALAGASVLFYPTAIGWLPRDKEQYGAAQQDAWLTVQRSHAITNGCYVAAVNRVGHETTVPGSDGLEFWGTSFLCDPSGVVVAQASTDKEETLIAEVDCEKIEFYRREWPFLRDRRIDFFGDITRRFRDAE